MGTQGPLRQRQGTERSEGLPASATRPPRRGPGSHACRRAERAAPRGGRPRNHEPANPQTCGRYSREMRYRTFGRLGWEVSEIGYGMWGMGGWTGSDDDESRRSLDRAVELGCNFFDTAWAYGDGKSETAAGELLRRHRDRRPVRGHEDPAEEPAAGRRSRTDALEDVFPPTTSASTRSARWRTWASARSTCSSSTSGRITGPTDDSLAAGGRRPEARRPRARASASA